MTRISRDSRFRASSVMPIVIPTTPVPYIVSDKVDIPRSSPVPIRPSDTQRRASVHRRSRPGIGRSSGGGSGRRYPSAGGGRSGPDAGSDRGGFGGRPNLGHRVGDRCGSGDAGPDLSGRSGSLCRTGCSGTDTSTLLTGSDSTGGPITSPPDPLATGLGLDVLLDVFELSLITESTS
jgi:hypothetical protein